MKNTFKTLILITILLPLQYSCIKELDTDLKEEEKKVVVNSLLNEGEIISLTVTKSFSPNKPENIQEFTNATVELFKDGQFLEILNYSSNNQTIGSYTSSATPVANSEYSFKITVPNYNLLTGKSYIPQEATINNPSAYYTPWGDTLNSIRFTFDFDLSNSSTEDYYALEMSCPVYKLNSTSGQYEFYTNQQAQIILETILDYQQYLNNEVLFTDNNLSSGSHHVTGTATMYTDPCCYNDTDLIIDKSKLYIRLKTLSSDAYKFHSSHAIKIENSSDYFSEPTPIYSNVENGFGIIGGENSTNEVTVDIAY